MIFKNWPHLTDIYKSTFPLGILMSYTLGGYLVEKLVQLRRYVKSRTLQLSYKIASFTVPNERDFDEWDAEMGSLGEQIS